MPVPTPTPTDETGLQPPDGPGDPELPAGPGLPSAEAPPAPAPHVPAPHVQSDPDAPVSFVPHVPVGSTARPQPLRIRTGRFGELEEHELVRLLDTIEDERARARFRE